MKTSGKCARSSARFLSPETALTACGDRGSRNPLARFRKAAKRAPRRGALPGVGWPRYCCATRDPSPVAAGTSGRAVRRHQRLRAAPHAQRHAVLKLLNVSKKQQRERFLERLERPEKNWKFSLRRSRGAQALVGHRQAFEQMVQNTSTKWAPWWVIPADHKWVTRTLVAAIITRSIDGLGVAFPKVSDKDRLRLAAARTELLADE